MTIELTKDFGHTLSYDVVSKGLTEMCPGLHFDLGGAKGLWHPNIETRAGVYYDGTHVCAIDRGPIPEYKVWNVTEQPERISIHEAVRDGHTVAYRQVLKGSEYYEMGADKARDPKHEDWFWKDGKLFMRMAYKLVMKRGTVIRVGWRHTFEALLNAKFRIGRELPGITRDGLAKKFGVDMSKYPVGTPDEVCAVLMDE